MAGFFLVSYLLGPGAIYRLAFSVFLPSKRLQRTRTEEVVFSAIITVGPFLLTWLLLCHTPIGRFPHLQSVLTKSNSYHVVLGSLVGDTTVRSTDLQPAYVHFVLEQARFVVVLWSLCLVEGWLTGVFVARYGDYQDGTYRKAICDKFLLKYVSEWQVLFTNLPLSSKDPRTQVEVDVLSSSILYRGRLVNWFTDSDGKLAGIFLQDAARFKRDQLDKDKANGKDLPIESYWKIIPGANLYLPATSIANYNIRYVEPTESDVVAEELGSEYVVKLAEPVSSPPDEV